MKLPSGQNLVNSGSGNGLVVARNKTLPGLMLTKSMAPYGVTIGSSELMCIHMVRLNKYFQIISL